jgi:hypothetical protein
MVRSTSLCVTCKQKLAVQRGTDPVTLRCRRQCMDCNPIRTGDDESRVAMTFNMLHASFPHPMGVGPHSISKRRSQPV